MCKNCCSFRNLLALAASLAGAVLFVVILNLAIDPIYSSKSAAPAPVPQTAQAPAAKAPEPAPAAPAPAPQAPAPAPAPAPEVQPAPAPVTAPAPAPVAAADPFEAGKKVFNQCKACHSVEPGKNLVGPSLAGVVGRKRAGVAGFKYSDAMAASHDPWTEAALSKYLADPKAAIPGNKMGFKGLADGADRSAVIAYLKSLGTK